MNVLNTKTSPAALKCKVHKPAENPEAQAEGFSYAPKVEGFKAVAEGDIIECIKHENVTRRIKM